MPRPVCVRCRREMTMEKSVTVQLNAFVTNGAYQQWQGDLARCDGCGAEVVTRFGYAPSWEHFRKDGRDPAPFVVVPERRGDGSVASEAV
jgi:hypothetical protein